MATIYTRLNKDGTRTYRVQLRRKGIPKISLSFSSLEQAEIWVRINEKIFIDSPEIYIQEIEKQRLNWRREREFFRKGLS